MKKVLAAIGWLLTGLFFSAGSALAHEVYVLTPAQVAAGRAVTGYHTYLSLATGPNIFLTLVLAVVVGVVLTTSMLTRSTPWGKAVRRWFERGENVGLLLVRLSLAGALCMSALSGAWLGPELSLTHLPGAAMLPLVMLAISGLLAVGLFTEVAALGIIIIYILSVVEFGWYMLTYFHYAAEALALLVFGAPTLALDRVWFGKARWRNWRRWELLLVRVGYGAALLFATINVKFLHPLLTQTVVTEYHLTSFHWLFPADPLLVVFGAGLVEMLISLFIIFGFQTRLVNMVMLFYITLSLLYFREAVWPHYILYGISLLLVLSPATYGMDYWIDRARRRA